MSGRQAPLLVVVAAPLLDLHPAPLGDDGAGGGELGVATRAGDRTQADGDGLAGGVGHLAGDRALPDQLVEPGLAGLDLVADLFGPTEAVARRADGLVGLLGVLDLLAVGPGRVGHRAGAVALGGLGPGGGDGGARQVGRVGPHVGDVAVLVQRLGHRMTCLADTFSARPASCWKVEVMNGANGPLAVGLGLDRPDREVGVDAARRRAPWRRPRRARRGRRG